MLVLQRKTEQSLVIGDKIVVKVLRVRGGRVTLGIEAPKKVKIRRNEVRRSRVSVADAQLD